jgi:hypothetical protein
MVIDIDLLLLSGSLDATDFQQIVERQEHR